MLYVGVLNRLLNADYKSVAYLKMGLVLAQKIHDKALCSKIYDQLGLTFQMMGYDRTAMLYFNRALVLTRKIGNRLGELCVYKNIGNFYLSGKRDEEALKYFTWLLQETGQSSPDLTGSIYSCIGHIYSTKKDYRSSLDYNLKALKIRQIGKIPVSVNSSLINIAGDYFNLEKPDSGKIYMDSGLILANRYGRKSYIENGYRHLYNYYNNQGNYKKALECYARFNSVHDEIIREQNKNNIAILEALQRIQGIQQTGKKFATEHVINSLNLKFHIYQTSVLKILIWAAGLSMVFFVLSLLYIRRGRRKMQKLHLQLSDEILEREAMEVHTRENETQYKFITDNSVDFITHLDHEKNRIYASPASLRVYGYEPEEIINKSPYDLTIPLFHALAETKFTEMVETKSARQFICQAQKKDGTVFWAESILHPLFDPVSGVFKGIVGVTRDIQERKTKEIEIMEGTKQKEILLKEIHHRVKNNFAILVSLINMQVAQTKNPELVQSLTNLQLRIRTMSLVHEMLYRSNDFEKISFPGYLRSLASVIAGTYNRRDILLTVEADEVVMDIEASIPLGLIINEILSNSFKHGFPDGRAGRISIIFQVDPKNGCQTLTLQDDGIGITEQTLLV